MTYTLHAIRPSRVILTNIRLDDTRTVREYLLADRMSPLPADPVETDGITSRANAPRRYIVDRTMRGYSAANAVYKRQQTRAERRSAD